MGANNCTFYSNMHLQEANLLWVKFSKTQENEEKGEELWQEYNSKQETNNTAI